MPTHLKPSSIVLGAVGLAFTAFIVALVAGSLSRPELATFAPTRPDPREVGEAPVGPRTYTVDARSSDDWIYFDFSRGSVVTAVAPASLDWDIAFRRHRMMTNGGATNPLGSGGAIDLGAVSIRSAVELPESGWVLDERRGDEPRNRALETWYDYSWMSHVLKPADRTFAVRAADGKYGLLRFRSYYCPGGQSGCVTFDYRYRGDGSRRFPETARGGEQSPGEHTN